MKEVRATEKLWNIEMLFGRDKKIKTDISVPGTTVLVGKAAEIKLLGLHEEGDSEIILFPQPSADPNDPLNWPSWRKHLHFGILFFFGLILAAASNFVGPIYTLLAEIYNVSLSQLNTGGALEFLFLAFSCLFCQPVAGKLGRRAVYLFSTLLTIISAVVFVGDKTYGGYLGYSILIGCAVGPIDSLIEVSITDIFFLHQHGKYIGIYSLTMGLGSAFGPFIAGYVTQNLGYLWCGYLLIIIAGGLLLVEAFLLEESVFKRTYESPELEDKLLEIVISNTSHVKSHTADIDLATKNNAVVELDSVSEPATIPRPKTYIELLRPFTITDTRFTPMTVVNTLKVLRYPAVLWCSIVYGIQICWLSLITVSESEFFMAPPYLFSANSVGLLSMAMVIGTVIGGAYTSCSDMVQLYFTRKNDGIFEPEFRLLMLPIPIFLNVVGLFMYGLGPYYGVHWIVGAIGIVFIAIALCCISGLSLNYVLECYPKQASATMTSVLFVRNLMGMVFTWVFQYWLDNVGVIGTTSMLAAFCLVINGSFIIIYLWGKNFRKYTQKWYENAE